MLPRAGHTSHPAQGPEPIAPLLASTVVSHKHSCEEMGAGTPAKIRSLAEGAQEALPEQG